jgi:hypothetical protein
VEEELDEFLAQAQVQIHAAQVEALSWWSRFLEPVVSSAVVLHCRAEAVRNWAAALFEFGVRGGIEQRLHGGRRNGA